MMDEATHSTERHRALRIGISLVYSVAGVLHLAFPSPFLTITPAWVPFPEVVIALTGACELLGALGLWFRPTRKPAAFGLALYAICVYPANIKHAIDGLSAIDAGILPWFYHLPRLALQPVLVWLPLFAAGILRWPRRRHRSD